MLTLTNNNCNTITGTSAALADVNANPSDYLKVEAKVTKNCCTTIYEGSITGTLDACFYGFNVTLPWATGQMTINSWKFVDTSTNIVTTVPINLLVLPNSSNLNALSQPVYNLNAGLAQASTSNTDFSDVGTVSAGEMFMEWDYNCNSPDWNPNIIPVSLDYTFNGIQHVGYFTPIITGGSQVSINMLMTGDVVTILPSILGTGVTKFGDGIYNVEIIITTTNGSTITENNCIFVDCESKCLMIDKLPDLSDDDKINILMLHYGMVEASQCGCSTCDLLCKLYTDFYNLLNDSNIPQTSGCGCS